MTLGPLLEEALGQPADRVSLASAAYPSRSVALEGKRDVLDAALAYLAPWWQTTGNGAVRVQVVEGSEGVESHLRALIREHQVIARTDLILAQVELPSWDYGWARFRGNNFYDLTLGRNDHIVVITGQSGPPPFLAAARTIRNLTVSQWLGDGALHLHAAALQIRDRGIVLLGDRHAGKTTQVCSMLERGIARFVSNDRVCLFPDGNLAGLPVSVNLRGDTQRRFPAINTDERPASNPHNISPDRPAEDLSLSTAEFAARFNAARHPGFVLTDVFHLQRDERLEGITASRASPEQTRNLLLENTLEHIDQSQPFWRTSWSTAPLLPSLGNVRCWSIGSGANTVDLTTDAIIYRLDP